LRRFVRRVGCLDFDVEDVFVRQRAERLRPGEGDILSRKIRGRRSWQMAVDVRNQLLKAYYGRVAIF